jgi:hypothetical protein
MYNQIGKRDNLSPEDKDFLLRYGKLPTKNELKQVRDNEVSPYREVDIEVL